MRVHENSRFFAALRMTRLWVSCADRAHREVWTLPASDQRLTTNDQRRCEKRFYDGKRGTRNDSLRDLCVLCGERVLVLAKNEKRETNF